MPRVPTLLRLCHSDQNGIEQIEHATAMETTTVMLLAQKFAILPTVFILNGMPVHIHIIYTKLCIRKWNIVHRYLAYNVNIL